jgi:hypothetical protein
MLQKATIRPLIAAIAICLIGGLGLVEVVEAAPRLTRTQVKRMDSLKSRAIQEIDKRLAGYSQMAGQDDLPQSTTAAKLKTMIDQETETLPRLKSAISGSQDPVALQRDVRVVADQYRVFGAAMPVLHFQVAVNRLTSTQERLAKLSGQLEQRIDQHPNQEQALAMKLLLSQLDQALDKTESELQTARTMVSALSIEEYPGNKTQLQAARDQLKKAAGLQRQAQQTIRLVVNTLIKQPSSEATASATPRINKSVPSPASGAANPAL